MTTFQVTPEELPTAAAAMTKTCADLGTAQGAVQKSAGAAAGTPAAAAYESLLGDAGRALTTSQTAVDDFSRALGRAASNYTSAENSATACYAPGSGP